LAESRIRLPVLGGISGSKMTMWNIDGRDQSCSLNAMRMLASP
jgi:hypothetical protein